MHYEVVRTAGNQELADPSSSLSGDSSDTEVVTCDWRTPLLTSLAEAPAGRRRCSTSPAISFDNLAKENSATLNELVQHLHERL